MKQLVTLVDFPFAKANTAIELDGFTQIMGTYYFTGGNNKYEVSLGKQVREFDPAKDSKLPTAKVPSPITEVPGQLGGYAAAGALIYFMCYKKDKPWYSYLGWGLLGLIGGGIAGRTAAGFFVKTYDFSTAKAAVGAGSTTDKSKVDLSSLALTANTMGSLAKDFGGSFDNNKFQSAVISASKNYSPTQMDILNTALKSLSNNQDPNTALSAKYGAGDSNVSKVKSDISSASANATT